jgi:hypothetical protein
METLTLVLIFVLVAAITFAIAEYYKKKINYNILHQLVEAYDTDVYIQPKVMTTINFGSNASEDDLNKVVNDFMNNVSQKTCNKDFGISFPLAYSEKNQQVIMQNLGNKLQTYSIKIASMMDKATRQNDIAEMADCKNILAVLEYILLKCLSDFSDQTFIQYFVDTNRINILNEEVKGILFGNDWEYSPNLMDYPFFKELLYNTNYNQSKLENYVNYHVAEAKYNANISNGQIDYLNENFVNGFKDYLEPIYREKCSTTDDPDACYADFETLYNEKFPDSSAFSAFDLPQPVPINDDFTNEAIENAKEDFKNILLNSTC